MDGLKRYVNDDRFRVDGDKNMRLLAFAFTIVFVWTGPICVVNFYILDNKTNINIRSSQVFKMIRDARKLYANICQGWPPTISNLID